MKKILLPAIILFLFSVCIYSYYSPTAFIPEYPDGYTPLKNDTLARKYLPEIISDSRFQPVEKILYRAAEDKNGNIYIAYHPVWEYERNTGRGLMPFLNRILYTGGLSMQKIMFGKGDVESIIIKVNRSLQAVEMVYETAENYSEKNFSVKHKKIIRSIESGKVPALKVISWNHLFSESDESSSVPSAIKPEYFTDELWREYEMTKNPTTRILKNRAHEKWEVPQKN